MDQRSIGVDGHGMDNHWLSPLTSHPAEGEMQGCLLTPPHPFKALQLGNCPCLSLTGSGYHPRIDWQKTGISPAADVVSNESLASLSPDTRSEEGLDSKRGLFLFSRLAECKCQLLKFPQRRVFSQNVHSK